MEGHRNGICRSYLFQETCPLVRADETISGKIKVTAPEGRTVWHWGVNLKLECTISFFESLRTIDLDAKEVQIAEPSYVEGTLEIPFEINIDPSLIESYDGEMFGVRHGILVTLVRPWYTFDVVRHEPIMIQRVAPAPEAPDADAAKHVICVPDCGAECTLDYGRSSFNCGDSIRGTLSLANLSKPITTVKLVLYKIERGDDDECESVIREELLVGSSTPEPASAASKGEAGDDESRSSSVSTLSAPKRTNPVASDETISFECPVAEVADGEVRCAPTYNELNTDDTAGEDSASVRYYLRLLLGDGDGGKFWNTSEVYLHRAVLDGVVDVEV